MRTNSTKLQQMNKIQTKYTFVSMMRRAYDLFRRLSREGSISKKTLAFETFRLEDEKSFTFWDSHSEQGSMGFELFFIFEWSVISSRKSGSFFSVKLVKSTSSEELKDSTLSC